MSEASYLRGHLPPGVQDLFLEAAVRRRSAEAALRDLFSRWAYLELISPTYEFAENLAVGAGADLRQAMYRFFDREGRVLALRADFTTQVARIAATKLFERPAPLRCFYIGSVFRYEEPQVGNQREFTQAGVELLGADTPAADAEVVALAAAALEALGLSGFRISLGQVSIFRALTEGLPAEDLHRIRQAAGLRSAALLAEALDAAGVEGRRRELLARLPGLVGGPEVLEEVRTVGGAVAEAAGWLAQVVRLLGAYGVEDRVILDLGEVRGMEYYTGITFRGLSPGVGWPVLSGGRYDELVGQFGRPMAAVGFGLGIERVLLAQSRQAQAETRLAPELVVGRCDRPACLSLVRQLRAEGYRVELDVLDRDRETLREYARGRGARCVLFYQPADDTWLLDDGHGGQTVTADELWGEVRAWKH